MKKLFLFMALIVGSLSASAAEQYDELDLLGLWEVTSWEGRFPMIDVLHNEVDSDLPTNWNYFYFGEVIQIDEDNPKRPTPWWPIKTTTGGIIFESLTSGAEYSDEELDFEDFFISNGNKLHICFPFSSWTIRFIIETLTDKELKMHTYDGKCKVSMKKIDSPSAVNGVPAGANSDDATFSLDGKKVNNPSDGIFIVKKDGKTSKEVIR